MPVLPLRLMVYDRTCRGRPGLPGLTHAWWTGARLYRMLGRLDGWFGAASWAEALDWLATFRAGTPLAEVQLWMHGRWGCARLAKETLDASALSPGHPHHDRLRAVRDRMVKGDAGLWWFRTCETFGTEAGHELARAWSGFFGCRAAGHTHFIAVWQSGLHSVGPGQEPTWSVREGVPPGSPPGARGLPSRPGAPHTITCFTGHVPVGF